MTTASPAIACLGAGRMGRGIAVAFAYAGHTVTMIDVKSRSAEQFAKLEADARVEVRKTLTSLARFGLMKDQEADALMARVNVVSAERSDAALAEAGLVLRQQRQMETGFLAAGRLTLGQLAGCDVSLVTDDRVQSAGRALAVELDRPVQVAVVGQGDGVHALVFGVLDQLGDAVGAVEQAVMAVAVQVNEGSV